MLTSIQVSRLNIIRAIRDLPEPPSRSRRRRFVLGAATSALGLLWAFAAMPGEEPFALLLAPMLVLAGLVPFAGRWFGTRAAATAIAALIVAWGAMVFVLPDAAGEASIMVWVARGSP